MVMEKKNLQKTNSDLHITPEFPEEIRERRKRAYELEKQYEKQNVKRNIYDARHNQQRGITALDRQGTQQQR